MAGTELGSFVSAFSSSAVPSGPWLSFNFKSPSSTMAPVLSGSFRSAVLKSASAWVNCFWFPSAVARHM